VHLVGFIIRKYNDARSSECHITTVVAWLNGSVIAIEPGPRVQTTSATNT